MNGIEKYINKKLEDRFARGFSKDDSDMVAVMVDLSENLTNDQLFDSVVNFALAGAATTKILVTWSLYQIARDAHLAHGLFEEIRNGPEINYESLIETDSFPLLHGIIWETLRLTPSLPIMQRFSKETVTLPSGHLVPADSPVTINICGMGRDPSLWEDPLEYHPSRWIDFQKSVPKVFQSARRFDNKVVKTDKKSIRAQVPVSPESCFLEADSSYFPVFAGGLRLCVGKRLSIFSAKYEIAKLISRYEIKQIGTEKHPLGSTTYDAHPTFKMKGGLNLQFKKR